MNYDMISRRSLMKTGLMLTGTLAASSMFADAMAQRGADKVDVAELMKPGDLPDIVVGKADAPVTIVEYASMTCSHCASFHNSVYPQLKAKYIDTGKAKLVFREYPLDDLAIGASMLARCATGGEGPPALISELFKRQEQWAFTRANPLPKLFELVRQAGFTQATFDKCLSDQKLMDQLQAARKRAGDKFGINSTPTFFINGTRLKGNSLSDFEKAIDPLLTKS